MESKENEETREVAIIDTVAEFETDETPDGDTEITLIQFHEDAIMATEGDTSSQSRTLLGRLEDGRIIISESGDHVATVAMVDEEMMEEGADVNDIIAVNEVEEEDEEESVRFEEFSGSATSTTFITESGETIEVLTTSDAVPVTADGEDEDEDEDEDEEELDQNDGYVIQMPPNFRFTLLKSMFDNNVAAGEAYCDLPIFCSDGVAYSSKFLLSAASSFIRDMLTESDDGGSDVCLVVPDITKSDFSTFHAALFAAEKDDSLNAYIVIRTAEIFGIDFPLTTNEISSDKPLSTVDYSTVLGNAYERKRLLASMGYVLDPTTVALRSETRLNDPPLNFQSSSQSVRVLSNLLDSNSHMCKTCKRSFVDEQSLTRHFATLHSSRSLASVLRPSNIYACKLCTRTFGLSINLKKHIWLSHNRSNSSMSQQNQNLSGPEKEKKPRIVSRDASKEVKLQEKYEDMSCKICNFVALNWKQLKVHIMDHTNERPYKCDICPKGFKEPQKLQRHKISHTGVKAFKCKFCNKAFGLMHNMKCHERIHMGKGHECDYCGMIYSQIVTLKLHTEKHKKKGHVQTMDIIKRNRQKFSGRGRPSLAEAFRKKKDATESTTPGGVETSSLDNEESSDLLDDESIHNMESTEGIKNPDFDSGARSDIIEQCLDVAKIHGNDFIMPHD